MLDQEREWNIRADKEVPQARLLWIGPALELDIGYEIVDTAHTTVVGQIKGHPRNLFSNFTLRLHLKITY
jgi:hypothetical protein